MSFYTSVCDKCSQVKIKPGSEFGNPDTNQLHWPVLSPPLRTAICVSRSRDQVPATIIDGKSSFTRSLGVRRNHSIFLVPLTIKTGDCHLKMHKSSTFAPRLAILSFSLIDAFLNKSLYLLMEFRGRQKFLFTWDLNRYCVGAC